MIERVQQQSGAAAADKEVRHRKLTDAAQQFEAMFLEQLLKPVGVDGEDAGPKAEGGAGSETYQSFGMESVAKAIAKAGGMGIARQVVRQVERSSSSGEKDETAVKFAAGAPIQRLRDVR